MGWLLEALHADHGEVHLLFDLVPAARSAAGLCLGQRGAGGEVLLQETPERIAGRAKVKASTSRWALLRLWTMPTTRPYWLHIGPP